MNRLEEDDLFGNYTFHIGGKCVSRDLLDSINEIYFLDRHLNLSSRNHTTILDVGAGYGRLAHRMVNALPTISQYLCTDAFAISSFICEYYIRYRNIENRAKMIPLFEIEEAIQKNHVDIAVNVHSFSECRPSAIDWWISLLAQSNVRYLMIVPNADELQTNDMVDFGNIIERHGYRMIARDPKYQDPLVQKYAINPSIYYLFQLDKAMPV